VDPLTRDFIIDTIKNNLDRKHSSILISTHLINDVEALFDDVIILYEGKVLVWASVKELKAKYQMPLEEIFKEVIRHA
ncbi:MAG TPA: multidrug ABC transporter ATP-binding protein, partial [Ruminococcaceae bacterium]|nr:multidrug ABC transporter ATP-binding protein [Oscillospiraceae bacterium]